MGDGAVAVGAPNRDSGFRFFGFSVTLTSIQGQGRSRDVQREAMARPTCVPNFKRMALKLRPAKCAQTVITDKPKPTVRSTLNSRQQWVHCHRTWRLIISGRHGPHPTSHHPHDHPHDGPHRNRRHGHPRAASRVHCYQLYLTNTSHTRPLHGRNKRLALSRKRL